MGSFAHGVRRKKWMFPAQATPPPRSVTQNPMAGLAMMFAHGAGGTRSPATSMTTSPASVEQEHLLPATNGGAAGTSGNDALTGRAGSAGPAPSCAAWHT